jgi:hypothetical protein
VRTFKFSRDPQFVAELQNVVGPVSDSAEHAIVLCADEKNQIQVLNRTQSSPPPEKGRCGTMSHDHKRDGTATPFVALNALGGRTDFDLR